MRFYIRAVALPVQPGGTSCRKTIQFVQAEVTKLNKNCFFAFCSFSVRAQSDRRGGGALRLRAAGHAGAAAAGRGRGEDPEQDRRQRLVAGGGQWQGE